VTAETESTRAIRHDAEAGSDTLSTRAAGLIERDILSGLWGPETRLGIHALSAHYGIGATPLREGMSRLVSRTDGAGTTQFTYGVNNRFYAKRKTAVLVLLADAPFVVCKLP